MDDAVPKFFSYSSYQECSTSYTQVNRYELFYAKCPRSWITLTLSVTVSIDSRYWGLEKLASCDNEAHVRPYGGYLLASLSSSLTGLLTATSDLDDGSYISVFLREALEGRDYVEGKKLLMSVENLNTDRPNYL